MDNFARAERAIISAFSEACLRKLSEPPKLHESAATRTSDLAKTLRAGWPKNPVATRVSTMLDNWGLREKQRNELVHGCFTVRGGEANDWSLVNEAVEVKKGVAVVRRTPLTKPEAAAFLQAVIVERKNLESVLGELRGLKP